MYLGICHVWGSEPYSHPWQRALDSPFWVAVNPRVSVCRQPTVCSAPPCPRQPRTWLRIKGSRCLLPRSCWLPSPWLGGGLSSTATMSTDQEEPDSHRPLRSTTPGLPPRSSAQECGSPGAAPPGTGRSAGSEVSTPVFPPPTLSRGRPTALPSVYWYSACTLVNVEF